MLVSNADVARDVFFTLNNLQNTYKSVGSFIEACILYADFYFLN